MSSRLLNALNENEQKKDGGWNSLLNSSSPPQSVSSPTSHHKPNPQPYQPTVQRGTLSPGECRQIPIVHKHTEHLKRESQTDFSDDDVLLVDTQPSPIRQQQHRIGNSTKEIHHIIQQHQNPAMSPVQLQQNPCRITPVPKHPSSTNHYVITNQLLQSPQNQTMGYQLLASQSNSRNQVWTKAEHKYMGYNATTGTVYKVPMTQSVGQSVPVIVLQDGKSPYKSLSPENHGKKIVCLQQRQTPVPIIHNNMLSSQTIISEKKANINKEKDENDKQIIVKKKRCTLGPTQGRLLSPREQKEIMSRVDVSSFMPGHVFSLDFRSYVWNGTGIEFLLNLPQGRLLSQEEQQVILRKVKIAQFSPGQVFSLEGKYYKWNGHAMEVLPGAVTNDRQQTESLLTRRPLHAAPNTSIRLLNEAPLTVSALVGNEPGKSENPLDLLSSAAILQEKIKPEETTKEPEKPKRIPRSPPDDKGDYYIVCKNCGGLSKNFLDCDACGKELPGTSAFYNKCDSIKAPKTAVIIMTKVDATSALLSKKKFYGDKLKQAKHVFDESNQLEFADNEIKRKVKVVRKRQTARILTKSEGKKSKMVLPRKEPELVELLSDDDDNSSKMSTSSGTPASTPSTTPTPKQDQFQMKETVHVVDVGKGSNRVQLINFRKSTPAKLFGTWSQKAGGAVTLCKVPGVVIRQQSQEDCDKSIVGGHAGEEKVIGKGHKDIMVPIYQMKWKATKPSEDTLSSTTFDVRNVRVGTLRGAPFKSIHLTYDFLEINMEGEVGTYEFQIPTKDIVKCLVYLGHYMPVMFVTTTPECAQAIREKCKMTLDKDPCYDPTSSDEGRKRITILISKLNPDQGYCIHHIFHKISKDRGGDGTDVLYEIDNEGANTILVSSTPPEVYTPGTAKLVLRSVSSNDASLLVPAMKLLTWPSPPATGRIDITTEDIYCLNEGEFLNDVIIDFYLKYLVLHKISDELRLRTHVFSSFFYKRLTTKPTHFSSTENDPTLTLQQRRHHRVKKWTRNVDIFDKDYLLIPINEHSHWYLAIICFPGLEKPITGVRERHDFLQTDIKTKLVIKAEDTKSESIKTAVLENVKVTTREQTFSENTKQRDVIDTNEQPMETDSVANGEEAMEITASNDDVHATAADNVVGNLLEDEKIRDNLAKELGFISDDDIEDNSCKKNSQKNQNSSKDLKTTSIAKVNDDKKDSTASHKVTNDIDSKKGIKKVFKIITNETVVIKQPCILIFDSLNNASHSTVVKNVKEYLQAEWDVRKRTCRVFKDTIKGSVPKVPQQDNYSDCGVYVLQYAESFFEKPLKDYAIPIKYLNTWFEEATVKGKRKQIEELIYHLQIEETKKQSVKTETKTEPASTIE